MKRKQHAKTLNGADFWAPHEGLTVTADLLKLQESWFDSKAFVPSNCTLSDAKKTLQRVQSELRFLFIKVKPFVVAWMTRSKLRDHPKFTDESSKAILYGRELLSEMQGALKNSNGALQLTVTVIDFPGYVAEFDVEGYFGFAQRSLNEVLHLVKNGELIGMQPGQFGPPIYGKIPPYIKRRIA